MSGAIRYYGTAYGFQYGAAEVTRIASDDKKGWVLLQVNTPRDNIQVYVTKTGLIRVHRKNTELRESER